MKLAGQIALVTGGSRGIGRATALAFATEGADIAFCHLDDGPRAEETASEIRAPWMILAKTSRPKESVPIQCWEPGGARACAESTVSGL